MIRRAFLLLILLAAAESIQAGHSLVHNQRFRTIFASLGGQHHSLQKLSQALLLPPSGLLNLTPSAGHTLFQEHEKILKNSSIQDLYRNSLSAGFAVDPDLNAMTAASGSVPVSIIILPGFLSEFIDEGVFEHLFTQESALKKLWNKTLEQAPLRLREDAVFSLAEMNMVPMSMNTLVQAASIDHPHTGQALVNFYSLRPPFGSLETTGSLTHRANIYEQRIAKIFELMGKPGKYFILGYSLGGNTALEMIADCSRQCESKNNRFYKDPGFKGFVSLAAPAWGSLLADLSQKPGEPLQILLESLESIETKLNGDRSLSFYQIPGALVSDMIMIRKELQKMMSMLGSTDSGGLSVPSRDPGTDSNNVHATVRLFQKILQKLLPARNFLTDYLSIVRRFKILSQSFRKALTELTTENRTQWWAGHTLPSDKLYISLGGIMDHAGTETSEFMGTTTVDFTILRETYDYLNQQTGISLNDSQVSLHHSMFWPDIHKKLNPGQTPYHAINLGVLGTHHWGLAFPIAFPGSSGVINPFPRNLLIKSIARFISEF